MEDSIESNFVRYKISGEKKQSFKYLIFLFIAIKLTSYKI
jgi:hypothetical protein